MSARQRKKEAKQERQKGKQLDLLLASNAKRSLVPAVKKSDANFNIKIDPDLI